MGANNGNFGLGEGHDSGRERELLRAVVENAVDGIITIDPSGSILSVNPAVGAIFGYAPSELIGQNVRKLIPSPYHDEHDQYLKNYLDTGERKIIGIGREVQGQRKDGTVFPIDLAVSESHSELGHFFIGILRDISERKQAEEAARTESDLLRAVFETAVDGIVTIDEHGTILSANPAVEQIFGCKSHELIGQNVNVFMPEPHKSMHQEYVQEYLDTGKKKIIGIGREVRARKMDGTEFPMYLAVSETITETGYIFTGILRDLTERAAALELRLAKEASDQANKAKSEFLSRMSHELRTPLNAVLGFSQILQMRYSDPKIQEATGSILKAGQHLLNLINEVLDLSRIEAGSIAVSLEPVPLSSSISQAIELVKPLAERAQVKLSFDSESCKDAYVRADKQRLNQVFINLLSNSIKFNRLDGKVEIRCARVGDLNSVEFSDSGIGIPFALQSRLFQPFERLSDLPIEGTGLGLVLSQRFVELMGGTLILAKSDLQGSVFRIHLRSADASELINGGIEGIRRQGGAFDRSRGKVLCIEDNLSNLEVLNMVFEDLPEVELIPALQGNLGLELAKSVKPDVILLDIHLPDMHGADVLTRLQADPETAKIPVIILSADATPNQIRRLRQSGAYDYLTKPLDLTKFADVVLPLLGYREESGES